MKTTHSPIRHLAIGMAVTALVTGCATMERSTHLEDGVDGRQFYRGNTHTHTLWSDGDAAPEWAVAWYKDNGYDFLSLTDHNIVLHGTKTFPVAYNDRLTPDRVEQLQERFGHDNVHLYGHDGRQVMRLKTLTELRDAFEDRGEFLLVESEEITGHTHVNGINVRKLIRPSKSNSNVTSMREQIQAVHDHSKEENVPMFAHVDHPDWSRAISAEELAEVVEGRYFELYNGHGGVRNWGSESLRIPNTDKKWDIILAHRLSEDPDHIMYGVATDDTHNYFDSGAGKALPGRGWSMVFAKRLTARSLVNAYLRGDFYSSAGVTLKSIKWDDTTFTIEPQSEPGVTYTTQFIGTREGFNPESTPAVDDDGNELPHRTRVYDDSIGEILMETTEVPAVYTFDGDELYVRAKIISSKLKDQPFREGDPELAWTQPVILAGKDASK